MKINRLLRTELSTTTIVVTGPGIEGKYVPSLGAGAAVALDKASRLNAPGTFYVREYDEIIYRAEGDGKGASVLVKAA